MKLHAAMGPNADPEPISQSQLPPIGEPSERPHVAADDPWHGANPLDPVFRDDPYPGLAHLRRTDPVNHTPIGVWRLTRFADVERLLKDVPTGVRNAAGNVPFRDQLSNDVGPGLFMLQQDPPNHSRLRKLVSMAFTPRAIDRLRTRAQEVADEQISRVAESGEMDVIADLALPVPATMICEMMGVPTSDRNRFTRWTAEATHSLAAAFAPPEVVERAIAAGASLAAYFSDLFEDRRRNLGDDLVSDLIRAEEAGDRLSPEELLSQCIGLLIAGFETTIGLIGNGVRALLTHRDQLDKLRANPALIASCVEECLRFDGPIILTARVLREDTRFGDTTIPADSSVWGMLAAANRDPARFPDPDRFDITRERNEHLAFGGGLHFCLGAHLARMEAQIAIGTLVARLPNLELASTERQWGRSLFRVLERLPVQFSRPS